MLLFLNGSCIKESHHTSLHCSRDAKVFYMLCITKMCEIITKLPFYKNIQKSAKYTRSKKIFKNNSCTKY